MRRALLLASLAALPPLPPSAAAQAQPVQAQPVQSRPIQNQPIQASSAQALSAGELTLPAPVRVRTGQHSDRGRVVLHLGAVPAHSLRRLGPDHELRLRGRYRLDLSGVRRLAELSGLEARQEGADTVLLLRGSCDCAAETGSFDGMLYIDLRPIDLRQAAAGAPHAGAELDATRRGLLEEAIRLGLMRRDQAEALLRGEAQPPATAPAPLAAPPAPALPVPIPQPAIPAPLPASAPSRPPAPADEMAGLRAEMLNRLALLNGAPVPAPLLSSSLPPSPLPASAASPFPAPEPRFAPPAEPPVCLAPSFSMEGWAGTEPFAERLAALRAAQALSEQGAAETAALAEFLLAHGLAREALATLETPLPEQPSGALRHRLERARDLARLLLRQPAGRDSPLLAEAADCAWPDLPLWRGLAAALAGEGAALARSAPQIRAALREVPPEFRLAFTEILADAVEEDAETLRLLLGALRPAADLRPAAQAARAWLLARLARLEGNRADEVLHLEAAARGGRGIPALRAQARLAALALGQPGAEGQRAEQRLIDFSRTYRFDSLGEEAAILHAGHLLERGAIAAALAVADGASQASLRPSMESRGARLAAQALRRLLVEAGGTALPPPAERLSLFWRYEGYATPGERGDDIRLGALRLMLAEGLADSALDLTKQITPASLQHPEVALLAARAEAAAATGDPQRALALLRGLPPSEEARRATSTALARLGRPAEAAAELAALPALPDRQRRAALLFQARNWPDAAEAYAALLRDPALDAPARGEATARLASSAALARQRPEVPAALLAPGDEPGTAALLRLSETAAPAPHGLAAARHAIARSRQIEQLLPQARN